MSVIFDSASATNRRYGRAVLSECRAVEEGHRCRWDAKRNLFLVKPDTTSRTTPYELSVGTVQVGGEYFLVVSCTCPNGVKGSQRPVGVLGCKHRSLVARRMERAGFAGFGLDGRWRVTDKLLTVARSLGGWNVFASEVE